MYILFGIVIVVIVSLFIRSSIKNTSNELANRGQEIMSSFYSSMGPISDSSLENIEEIKKILRWLKGLTPEPPIEGLTREKAEEIIYELAKKLGMDLDNKPGLKTESKFDSTYMFLMNKLDAMVRVEQRRREFEAKNK